MNPLLIISTSSHPLHSYEFVKPIQEFVCKSGAKTKVVHFSEVSVPIIKDAAKVIICGTSLQDFGFLKGDFTWLKNIEVPVLGICAGMQMLCKVFGCSLYNQTEIGQVRVCFEQEFLGLEGWQEVYTLHNLAVKVDNALRNNFRVYTKHKVVHAVKHRTKQLYGVLFHPEVRQTKLLKEFLEL